MSYLPAIYWILGVLVLLIVVHDIRGSFNRDRARKLLPQILGRDWVDGRDLCNQLKARGVSLSYGSFYLMMRDEGNLVDSRDNQRVIDGQVLRIRQYRRKFAVPTRSQVVAEHAS